MPGSFNIENTTSGGLLVAPADAVALKNALATVHMIYNGATVDMLRTANKFITLTGVDIHAEATVWTPATGKKFRWMGFSVVLNAGANDITFKDNTGGTTIYIMGKPAANVTVTVNFPGNGILSAAANNVLTATGTTATTISGTLWGCEE